MVEDYLQGRLNVDDFVTHTNTLQGINDGFSAMKAGDCSAYLRFYIGSRIYANGKWGYPSSLRA